MIGVCFLLYFCSIFINSMNNTFSNNKNKYGEVFTPPFLIQQMIDDLKTEGLDNHLSLVQADTIFEPGAGKGVFFDIFVNKNNFFKDNKNFKYTMNEINYEHFDDLKTICKNYSDYTEDCLDLDISKCKLIIGNLPFNCETKKFVPSLAKNNKDNKSVTQSKSVTLWTKITHFCFDNILKDNGYFYAIIPCIWLKPDRGGIYDLFTRYYSIILLKTFDCQIANTIFKYNCQTPICYVLVHKKKNNHKDNKLKFKLYDHQENKYLDFVLDYGKCIPTHCISHFISHSQFLKKRQISSCYEYVLKISTLNPKCLAGETKRFSKGGLDSYQVQDGEYKIITGSLFNKKTKCLTLNGFVSTVPCLYYGKPKIILPHKRLAKFFKDYDGSYSCYGRDMYVFLCNNKKEIDELYNFFNDNVIVNQMIETGFTIRMNFIEKYVFQYIPWIFDENFDHDDYQDSCC